MHRSKLYVSHGGHGGAGTAAHGTTSATARDRVKQREHHAQKLTANTTVRLVKAETGRSVLATARSVMAVLRPAPRKKASCGGAGLLEARLSGLEGEVGRGRGTGKHN